MFNLPVLDKINLENEEYFDVDALPDMNEEEAEKEFIDVANEKKQLDEIKSKNELTLPKDQEQFKEAYYKREGNKLRLDFKIETKDLKNMAKTTFGLFSTDVNEGSYEFEIADTDDENIKELYYYDEFSGEIIDDEPRVYKRYFFTAVVRSLVKQEILFEHEQNKFSIHPVFFIKLQVHSASIAAAISNKGFPVADMEEYERMKETEDKIKGKNKESKKDKNKETNENEIDKNKEEKKKDESIKGKATSLF
jgi:hypothetical protein